MKVISFVNKHKKLIVFLASCCAIINLYLYWPGEVEYATESSEADFQKFSVYTNKCSMPELDPWCPEALLHYFKIEDKSPGENPELIKMERDDDIVYLSLNEEAAQSKMIGYCKSCVIRSGLDPVPDDTFQIVHCENFTSKVAMRSSVMHVECFSKNNNLAYKDVLANYVPNKFTATKLNDESTTSAFNVLIIGYDSISRQNLRRTMPKTVKYLRNTGWSEFIGYNKIAENTLPNLIGVLTGKLVNNKDYSGKRYNGFFDDEEFVWKNFQEHGYVTVFIEDDQEINTFNNGYKGFRKSPTDFYFRTYAQAMESLPVERLSSSPYRTGEKVTGQRIQNLALELPLAFKNQPYFGFFWMNTFSHNNLNTPQLMDNRTVEFFQNLLNTASNNTFVIFMSDHGFRMGPFRKTIAGFYEDRMPFLYVKVPESFRMLHLKKYENLLLNTKKLTSGFDLYKTLQDILFLSNAKYVVHPAKACPQCLSFFQTIPNDRSCSEAGIPKMFCTCSAYVKFDKKHKWARQAGTLIVEEAQYMLDGNEMSKEKCWRLKLAKVVYVRASQVQNNITDLLLVVQTNPLTVLEGIVTVFHDGDDVRYGLVGNVLRIDAYKDTSKCIDNSTLKPFCYCSPYGYLLYYAGL